MTGAGTSATANYDVLMTLITEKILEGVKLEVVRLYLSAKQEELECSKNELTAQCSEHVPELCNHSRQVNTNFNFSKKKDVHVFALLIQTHVVTTMEAHAIEIPEGAAGHDKLHQICVKL